MSSAETYSLFLATLQTLAVLVGIILGVRQLRRSAELAASQNAFRLIERWTDIRQRAREHKGKETEGLDADYVSLVEIMDFFEMIAISIKTRSADETLLQLYFPSIFHIWLSKNPAPEIIQQKQKVDPTIYENLVDLVAKWNINLTEEALASGPNPGRRRDTRRSTGPNPETGGAQHEE